jgi:adenine-specific DNA-methyltransferase
VVLSQIERQIKEKIERVGTPLKDWDIQINYGIKTGFNEAFIIDGKKRQELINQDPKSAEIIRPILRVAGTSKDMVMSLLNLYG